MEKVSTFIIRITVERVIGNKTFFKECRLAEQLC